MTTTTSEMMGWVTLFHPSGAKVNLPVLERAVDYAAMFQNVGVALDAGWLVAAPGLEAGEEKDDVGYVVHGEHEKDGEVTPFVLLYSTNEAYRFSFLKVWLNRKDDIEAFEYASKMKLDSIPVYIGNDKPERGAAAKTDKFILKAPKPFGVVFKANPKHDPSTEEGKMKPARLFIRWSEQKPKAESAPEPAETPQTPTLHEWASRLAADPNLVELNRMVQEVAADKTTEKAVKWKMLGNHAQKAGLTFDREQREFYREE